jgi:hypothetical protein
MAALHCGMIPSPGSGRLMRRRDFITLIGGSAVAWPHAARAQQPSRMRHIGVLAGNLSTAADPLAEK